MNYASERVRMAAAQRAARATEKVMELRRERQEAYEAVTRKEDARLKRQRLRESLA